MIKRTTLGELLTDLPANKRDELLSRATRLQATAVVRFANVDFCSSAFGDETYLLVGPACTYFDAAEIEGKFLNDLPSQRQYPQAWAPLKEDA